MIQKPVCVFEIIWEKYPNSEKLQSVFIVRCNERKV